MMRMKGKKEGAGGRREERSREEGRGEEKRGEEITIGEEGRTNRDRMLTNCFFFLFCFLFSSFAAIHFADPAPIKSLKDMCCLQISQKRVHYNTKKLPLDLQEYITRYAPLPSLSAPSFFLPSLLPSFLPSPPSPSHSFSPPSFFSLTRVKRVCDDPSHSKNGAVLGVRVEGEGEGEGRDGREGRERRGKRRRRGKEGS